MRRILAFFTTFGMFVCTRSLSMTMPFISSESLILPPTFFSTLMSSMSTVCLPSFTESTDFIAATVSSAILSVDISAPLPVTAVPAIVFNTSSSSTDTVVAIDSKISFAFSAASLYPLAMIVGCISSSSRSSAFLRSSPVSIAAVVVPSPTSSSCVLATSTTILAAGCSMSISFRIVAPSLVITISPSESTSILSMPFGPSVVLTALATAFAAVILLLCASFPFDR